MQDLSEIPKELRDDRADSVDLSVGQRGRDRQSQGLGRRPLGHREVPGPMAQMGQRRLKMKRNRVVDRRRDAVPRQMILQLLTAAARNADDELVPDAPLFQGGKRD